MSPSRVVIVSLTLLGLSPALALCGTFHSINFSADHNHRLQNNTGDSAEYPEGSVTLGGVPFEIPTGGNNAWHSVSATTSTTAPVSLDVSVNQFGVESVFTLINNYWGRAGAPALAKIEFFGSDTGYLSKDLLGGGDIRDFLASSFTNSIVGPGTVNVFESSGSMQRVRLDMQTIMLPPDFADEMLTTVRLTDMGGSNIQRVWLAGLTVNAVPEPASGLLLILGLSSILAIRSCRNKQ